jgi:hypothetical protein
MTAMSVNRWVSPMDTNLTVIENIYLLIRRIMTRTRKIRAIIAPAAPKMYASEMLDEQVGGGFHWPVFGSQVLLCAPLYSDPL